MTTVLMPLGGPSVLIEIDDRRLLVDPTFDPAGDHPIGGRALTKTTDAILGPDDLGSIDAVLLSPTTSTRTTSTTAAARSWRPCRWC